MVLLHGVVLYYNVMAALVQLLLDIDMTFQGLNLQQFVVFCDLLRIVTIVLIARNRGRWLDLLE